MPDRVRSFTVSDIGLNAKLSNCRQKRKIERERRVRIAAQHQAERRGGRSSPASGDHRRRGKLPQQPQVPKHACAEYPV
jgi:hypothetical protein